MIDETADRRLGCALTCLIVAGVLFWTVFADAQEPIEAQLGRAIITRLRVWERPDGTPIYIRHCRAADGGCEARVRRLSAMLARSGREHGVDPWLLAAIAVHESGTNPNATGGRGEFGVMQLMPISRHGRAASLRCAGAPGSCPAIDVDVAARILRAGMDRCGGEAAALGLYNSGRCGPTAYSAAVLRLRSALQAPAG